MNLKPSNQTKIYGLENYLQDFIKLDNKNILPNKILLSGSKGVGKSTLAYHLINYSLSKNNDYSYFFDQPMNISPHLLIDAVILSTALTITLVLRAKGNAARKEKEKEKEKEIK